MFTRTIAGIVCVSAAGSMLAMPTLTPSAAAQSEQSHVAFAQETVRGVIQEVDHENNWFTIKTSEDEQMRIKVSEDTDYTLNGEESSKEEALQKGAHALVRHEDGTASRVDARTQ